MKPQDMSAEPTLICAFSNDLQRNVVYPSHGTFEEWLAARDLERDYDGDDGTRRPEGEALQ